MFGRDSLQGTAVQEAPPLDNASGGGVCRVLDHLTEGAAPTSQAQSPVSSGPERKKSSFTLQLGAHYKHLDLGGHAQRQLEGSGLR
jgi:hypothetical protein